MKDETAVKLIERNSIQLLTSSTSSFAEGPLILVVCKINRK
jgi:hypothetical protein